MISLDYLAGFFDAEGCVHAMVFRNSTGVRHQISVIVSNVHLEPLEAFKERFGGFIRQRKMSSTRHRKTYNWVHMLSRKSCFLGISPKAIIKRSALELAGEFLSTLKPGSRWSGGLSEDDLQRRDRIAASIKASNHCAGNGSGIEFENPADAYWAGLFDGDGSVTVSKRSSSKRLLLRAYLHSSNEDVMRIGQKIFGGFIYKRNVGKCSTLVISTLMAEKFLRKICPYLVIKGQTVKRALDVRRLNGSTSHYVFSEMQQIKADLLGMNRLGA